MHPMLRKATSKMGMDNRGDDPLLRKETSRMSTDIVDHDSLPLLKQSSSIMRPPVEKSGKSKDNFLMPPIKNSSSTREDISGKNNAPNPSIRPTKINVMVPPQPTPEVSVNPDKGTNNTKKTINVDIDLKPKTLF